MSTYLLDTNVIIDVLNDRKGRRALLLDLLNQGHLLACCPVNVSTISDATIAAVARHHKLTLITANVRDFPMKDLSIYSL